MSPGGSRVFSHDVRACFLSWICTVQILHNVSERQVRIQVIQIVTCSRCEEFAWTVNHFVETGPSRHHTHIYLPSTHSGHER